ncbi:unnamed protein product [Amoebophrya sp. A25]|nr:unnamed protein product [Amoebophrya sp. A25]|eukprot:GSA25T00005417001.1
MGNDLNKYAKSYVAEQVSEKFMSQLPFYAQVDQAFNGNNERDREVYADGGSSIPAGSPLYGGRPSKDMADTGSFPSRPPGTKAEDWSCYGRDRSCCKRACAGPVSYFGDPTFMMSVGLWTLRFGFPLLGWFFFVAIGKFAAGFGSAFLFFYLISRVDFSHGPAKHAPSGHEAAEYRCPEWLSTHRINFAVAGAGGVGKSTLINTLRGLKAKDPLAAQVGAKETTMEPMDYRFPSQQKPFSSLTNLDKVSLWDLPGVGTEAFPAEHYVKAMGLRYFDGVLIVTAERFTQNDIMLMNALAEFDVPFYMIRNKVDQAVEMEYQEYGRAEAAVLEDLRKYYREQSVTQRLYFLSAAKLSERRLDFDDLLFQIASDLSSHRKLL